jgi:hypothetical protein
MRKNKKLPEQFQVGENITCKKYLKLKEGTLNQNIEFKIISILKNIYKIENITTLDIFDLKIDTIHEYFISSYASTCHSYQGSSTDEKITIFDYSSQFITAEWLYVACTRCTDFNNVYYYNGPSLWNFKIEEFARKKINNYKQQDIKAGREITTDYINIEWFKKFLKSPCHICGETIAQKDFTADRINNDICHTIDNCKACCLKCNVSNH